MTCDRAMDLFMEGNDGERVPFIRSALARLHLLRCRKCSAEVQRLNRALELMRADFLPKANDSIDPIMAAVRMEVAAQAARAVDEDAATPVSTRNWAVGGLFIFASLAVFPLGQASGWLVRLFGSDLTFPIALTLGVVLTAYCALFIGSHLDELSERFGLPRAG